MFSEIPQLLFNSISYLIFLPVVTVVLFLLPARIQWMWLLIASLAFYYTILPAYLILFCALIPVNYYFGLSIHEAGSGRRMKFVTAILVNLLVLAIFKYFNVLDPIWDKIVTSPSGDILNRIILPLGLSYFIFTLLSYLIEVKRGNVQAERHFGMFAASLLFFPKMLQGPIERPGNLFPQFRKKLAFDYTDVTEGLKLMLWGYFKKLVVADRIAIYVDAVYGNAAMHTGTSLALATLLYAFQLYADFSGYTDIALGSARIMGIRLTQNFRRPYLSSSIKDFWNRWHISFSTWLRDYLFLPLAYFFSKKMKKEKYAGIRTEKWIFMFSAMITFTICGIWHGETLNYMVWGIIFGIYLSIAVWTAGFHKSIRKKLHISKQSVYNRSYQIILTFLLVCFSFIFFRAGSLDNALLITGKIFTSHGAPFIGSPSTLIYSLLGIAILLAADLKFEFFAGKFSFFHNPRWLIRQLSYSSVIILILLFGVFDGGQFIYFKF